MNGILTTKDIRFPDKKINVLLRGGIVSRDQIKNVKDSILEMTDVPFGIAKRINAVTAIDINNHDNWETILCGDEDHLKQVYTHTPIVIEEEHVEKRVFSDHVNIEPVQTIEEQPEEVVEEATIQMVDDAIDKMIAEMESTPVEEEQPTEEVVEETTDTEEPVDEEAVVEEPAPVVEEAKPVTNNSQSNVVFRQPNSSKKHRRH